MATVNERVKFRIFKMPCCSHNLCWVNPRLPTYCPECGTLVFTQLKSDMSLTLLNDEAAVIRFHN